MGEHQPAHGTAVARQERLCRGTADRLEAGLGKPHGLCAGIQGLCEAAAAEAGVLCLSADSGEWRVESGEWRVESGEWDGVAGGGPYGDAQHLYYLCLSP